MQPHQSARKGAPVNGVRYQFLAEISGDGCVGLGDINPFVALLSGS
jgi:hypothetical protein